MVSKQRIAIVGVGRMGKVLAQALSRRFSLYLYDRNVAQARYVAAEIGAIACRSFAEVAQIGTVILAVPDREIAVCVAKFNALKVPVVLINIATNVSQKSITQKAESPVTCVSAKFVAHAGEMALGHEPLIIIHSDPAEYVDFLKKIFASVGEVMVGDSDLVTIVNTLAAQNALRTGVLIEQGLRDRGVTDDRVIRRAIQLVAAGTLKAYAAGDLGPFARNLVCSIREQLQAASKDSEEEPSGKR